MIIRNKSNKLIGIGGEIPVVILPDEEKIVPDADAKTNGIATLERMGLIECHPEPVAEQPKKEEPPQEEQPEKKSAAKKTKAKSAE